jgi:outer membrane protein TolC
MSRQTRAFWAFTLIIATVASGCKPIQPFYLGEHDDLSHYLGVATELEYPDADVESLTEVTMAQPPLTLSSPQPRELWDLTLEEAIHISLHNAKILKVLPGASDLSFANVQAAGFRAPGLPDTLRRNAANPDVISTIYNPAVQETSVGVTRLEGVESALAAFDAQLNHNFFWNRTDRPLNFETNDIFPPIQQQDQANFVTELTKRTAPGTQFTFRNNTTYEYSNAESRAVPSDWLTNFEVEARQPLMQGAGTQVNRVPIVLARIRTDITLAEFEVNVRNHVFDTEKAYWELQFAYRNLEAAKAERDSVHYVWVIARNKEREGIISITQEAQARQQYFRARARVEGALIELFKAENRLRYMLGLTPTDGRLIRPVDEPLNARVHFDWHEVLAESLFRSGELRIKRWQIKQREMELIQARNLLLPRMDAVALYRWLGRGDDLLNDRDGPPFTAVDPRGSDALEELFHGDFQEWRLGVEFALPVGFRRELAGVRHAQLLLARECALLKETELELTHGMTDSMQNADGWYALAETNFNRRVVAELEVESLLEAWQKVTVDVNVLLDALTRRADAQALFYRSLVNYTIAVSEIHFHKGSLLEHDNVLLAEGPWPAKAYCDAQQLARQRSAGHYLDYGFTRPRVISRGPVEQFQHNPAMDVHSIEGHDAGPAEGELVPTPAPLPDGGFGAADAPPSPSLQVTGATPSAVAAKSAAQATSAVVPASATISTPAATPSGDVEIRVKGAKFDWGPLKAD